MKRRHDMPFGARVLEGGEVRFRLWAPGARSVELCLDEEGGERLHPMRELEGGWREALAPGGAGTRYRFRIDGQLAVPDPASRHNPEDVHGPSEVIDPLAFDWQDEDWSGRPWEEAAVYELHVGAFTPEGTFAGVESRLDYLVDLGVTAVELMPVADFPGRRGWGYDGVLPFAPEAAYGRPEDLKRLVQAAHRRGLMMLLDVVYNHFGPEGNYLHAHAPAFFTDRHHTPWGQAIDFSHRTVRDFFIHNALYWLEEFHFDGLRLDAVHAIDDDSPVHILTELADTVNAAVHAGPGKQRHVHLVLENDRNSAHLLERDAAGRPRHYTAQWNDDFHHAAHAALTGERDGYYADYGDDPIGALMRCLCEGFAYQGERSPFRGGEKRGEPSDLLPPAAFVNFLQNHDQTGNRALGERLGQLVDERRLAAAAAILLLAPSPPLLFMGEEFAAGTPFLYFCDFEAALAASVRAGRQREFAQFARFSGSQAESIPDPGAEVTLQRSKIDWASLEREPHARALERTRGLLRLRARHVMPLASKVLRRSCSKLADRAFEARWECARESLLLRANLGDAAVQVPKLRPYQQLLHASVPCGENELPPWSAIWLTYIGADEPAERN